MFQENKDKVNRAMIEAGIIPVFNHADLTVCIKVLEACYAAGLRVFEFTNRGSGAKEVFIELARYVQNKFPDFFLGAGTVLDIEDAGFYIDNKALFIVAPHLDLDIAKFSHGREIPWIPGCGTLTEIMTARKAGADLIKVFPGNTLGPSFISAVLGPVPDLKLMPTGGVNPVDKDLREWFAAGVSCVGLGSQLFSKNLIEANNFEQLTQNIKATKELVDQIRKDNLTGR